MKHDPRKKEEEKSFTLIIAFLASITNKKEKKSFCKLNGALKVPIKSSELRFPLDGDENFHI
jgi:hypothetical protein